MPVSDKGIQFGRFSDDKGQVDIQVAAFVEPCRIFPDRSEFLVYDDISHPVDVGLFVERRMDGTDGKILSINIHLSIEGRGCNKTLRPEAYLPGLAAFYLKTVDKEKIIEGGSPVRNRGDDTVVENVDEIVVEIGLEMRVPGKLGNEIVLVHA